MERQQLNPPKIHYGSLAEHEALRIISGSTDEDIKLGIKAGNINLTQGDTIPLNAVHPSDNQKAILAEFERRKRARQLNLTTEDAEVRSYLRKLKKPVCVFGEGPGERRERLKQILSLLGDDVIAKLKEAFHSQSDSSNQRSDIPDNETWYHEGPTLLKAARLWIAKYSLPTAKERLNQARIDLQITETQRTARKQEIHKKINSFSLLFTQIGDHRPLSSCDLSSDGTLLSISSWSGLCKLWRAKDCALLRTFKGHATNVGCVKFRPDIKYDDYNQEGNIIAKTGDDLHDTAHMASCGHDGTVKLWNINSDECIHELEGHEPYRVSRLQFHPSGRFLATCCFDNTWRLWDLENREEILYQEGHSDAVFDIAFQIDGSLAATGSLDTYGRVWDLRTGHCIMFMEDHLKPIYSIDWHPNGFQLITGSQDNTCKIWDLRQRKCLYTIPAHQNLVSKVKFMKPAGECIMTASYDGTVKIWAHPGWMPIKTLKAQEGKIMGADVYDFDLLVTCGFDKTFKLWGPE
ncbi:unnamed protein product [Gordionus sp. m RMFG-2023]|uniref:U4/U6 small nuclear ribonucleoprotein Prp4-like n=1 Tax=Gordionus sp. m RMFG-2023 TaxID=3053472 RepID=UPI0030DF594A